MTNTKPQAGKILETCFVENAEFDYVVTLPSKGYYINYIVCCVVNVFLTLSTISLNATTVLAYWKSSQLKKKTLYFLVMLLSLNDTAVGVVSNSTFTVFLVREIMGYENCFLTALYAIVARSLSGMSLMTIFLLNFERYLSIFHPVFHRNKVTKRRLLVGAVSLWSFCAMETCLQFVSDKAGRIGLTSVLVFLLTVLAFIYVKLFRSARKIISDAGPQHGNLGLVSRISAVAREKRFLQKKKQAKGSLLVFVFTFLCFLPLAVMCAFERSPLNIIGVFPWIVTLVFMASTLNSVIFFWRNQTLRNDAKKVLRQVFCKFQ